MSGLSPSQRASLSAESIGQTSYSIQQQGISAASRWMAQVEAGAPRFDFSRMFITPAMQLQTDQWNEVNRFNVEWMGNKIAAMPSPLEQAGANALHSFGQMVDQYGSMALSGMGGGAGAAFGGSGGSSMFGGGGGGGGGGEGPVSYDLDAWKASMPTDYNSGENQRSYYPRTFG